MENTFYPAILHDKLCNVKMAIFDIDGVLTTGDIYYDANGEQLKVFNTLDGHGLKMLKKHNIIIAVISGRNSLALKKRMQDLSIEEVYLDTTYKLPIYDNLLTKYNLKPYQIAYMGDDIPDYPLLKKSGLSVCPNNAHSIIKNICDWNINIQGGKGAVRALCDAILSAQYGISVLLEEKA